MPIAINPDTNEAMYLDHETGWLPTKVAVNPDTGDRMAFDGSTWVPIKAPATPNPAQAADDRWRQGNKMPISQQPPERALAETPFGGMLKLGEAIKGQWDATPDFDMGPFTRGISGERDDPNRLQAMEQANKLALLAPTRMPAIARSVEGFRTSSLPRTPNANPAAIPVPPPSVPPPPGPSPVPPVTSGPSPAPAGGDASWLFGPRPGGGAPVTPGPNPAPPVMPTVRPRTGARLLPPETSHSLPPEPAAARSSVGAAASGHGPLTDLSPGAERMLRQVFEQEGISPYMVEQRLSEMSPHEFLGELSPNLKLHTSGLQSHIGQARNDIQAAVTERAREAPIRMASAFDEAFGPAKNGFDLIKQMKDVRSKDSAAAWKAFLTTPITPFPQLTPLMSRLEASGALRAADKAMREWGHPASNQFDVASGLRVNPNITTGGPPQPTQQVLTAASFQHAKEHLDLLIKTALRKEDDKGVMRYTALKNALTSALDNHPDPRIAGKWKQARQEWADPTQLMNAFKLGERVLSGNVHQHQLPMLTESFGPPEMAALAQGMRSHLFDRAGRPGKQDLAALNLVLAPSNQAKIASVIGDDKAAALIAGITHEHRMHTAPTDLIYGSQTAPREAAKKFWMPPESNLPGGLPTSLRGVGRMAIDAGLNFAAGKHASHKAMQFEKIREEAARIMMLQGAERDAALYHLTQRPGLSVVGAP